MPLWNERFARQYRDRHSSEFLQASPFTGIVHHLSGPNANADAQTLSQRSIGSRLNITSTITLILHNAIPPNELAHALDSSVRVSRRVGQAYTNHACKSIIQRREFEGWISTHNIHTVSGYLYSTVFGRSMCNKVDNTHPYIISSGLEHVEMCVAS